MLCGIRDYNHSMLGGTAVPGVSFYTRYQEVGTGQYALSEYMLKLS